MLSINEIYNRSLLLNAAPTKGLPGAAMAELMLLRAKHARPVADFFKLMEEATQKLRDDEKYAALNEKEAAEYFDQRLMRYTNIEAKEEDSNDTRELKQLMAEFNETDAKMRDEAAREKKYKPVGVLTEATFAAICEAVMAQGTVPGMADEKGQTRDIPAEMFLTGLAAVIEADSKPKK